MTRLIGLMAYQRFMGCLMLKVNSFVNSGTRRDEKKKSIQQVKKPQKQYNERKKEKGLAKEERLKKGSRQDKTI